jgi:hypothetical protein
VSFTVFSIHSHLHSLVRSQFPRTPQKQPHTLPVTVPPTHPTNGCGGTRHGGASERPGLAKLKAAAAHSLVPSEYNLNFTVFCPRVIRCIELTGLGRRHDPLLFGPCQHRLATPRRRPREDASFDHDKLVDNAADTGAVSCWHTLCCWSVTALQPWTSRYVSNPQDAPNPLFDTV